MIRAKSRLDVEKIHLNMHPNPAIFALDFPKGMGVADYIRDIIYVVGDSPEVIEKKLAAAGKEKAFYEAMLGKIAAGTKGGSVANWRAYSSG